jgi:hypothetical protein
MDKIQYSKEFRVLIEAFLKHQNAKWRWTQLVWVLACAALAFAEISQEKSPSYVLVILGQSAMLYYLYAIHRWHKRYAAGIFLTERTEAVCFRDFALKNMKKDQAWLDKEILKMLNGFIKNL